MLGAGPGWIIVIAGVLVTGWTVVVAIYWSIKPGETAADHPKRLILRNDR